MIVEYFYWGVPLALVGIYGWVGLHNQETRWIVGIPFSILGGMLLSAGIISVLLPFLVTPPTTVEQLEKKYGVEITQTPIELQTKTPEPWVIDSKTRICVLNDETVLCMGTSAEFEELPKSSPEKGKKKKQGSK